MPDASASVAASAYIATFATAPIFSYASPAAANASTTIAASSFTSTT